MQFSLQTLMLSFGRGSVGFALRTVGDVARRRGAGYR